MSPAAVIVILNGAIVASAPPAQLLSGHVIAPLVPVVTSFTERAAVDGETITLERGGRTCVVRAVFGQDGVAYVPLAEVARAFGGAAEYDPHTHVVTLDVPGERDLKTPAPFDPSAPSAAPTEIFTPSPAPAPRTAQPLDAGSPMPRRTAIPAIPSRVPEN
jgi:hypothetical protein